MEAHKICADGIHKSGGKPTVAVFDFDGTLITGDSFLILGRASAGSLSFFIKLALCSPWLVSWKLGFISNENAKRHLFSLLFKGVSIEKFRNIALDNIELLTKRIRKDILSRLKSHVEQGDRVYIISANFTEWLKPFFANIGITKIIATEVGVDENGSLTGLFNTPNCYGKEKVRRFLEVEPCRDDYFLVTYGDSAGDRDMMSFSDSFVLVK